MKKEQLQEVLDDLPKKLHDMYAFEIIPEGPNCPAYLRMGRSINGIMSEVEITPLLEVVHMEDSLSFRNSYQFVYLSTHNYSIYEYRR
jgi:hypothetical protein